MQNSFPGEYKMEEDKITKRGRYLTDYMKGYFYWICIHRLSALCRKALRRSDAVISQITGANCNLARKTKIQADQWL